MPRPLKKLSARPAEPLPELPPLKRESKMEALRRTAAIISGNFGIQVVFAGNRAYTDFKRIVVPSLPDNAPDDLVDAITGYVDHEIGHILFTDPNEKRPFRDKDKRAQFMTNAVEDVRQEFQTANLYRGMGLNLDRSAIWSISKIRENWQNDDAYPAFSRFLVLAICWWRAKVGGLPEAQQFLDDCGGETLKVVKHFAARIEKWHTLPSTSAAYDEAKAILAELDKLNQQAKQPPLPPPPPPPPSQQPDEEAGEGGGQGQQDERDSSGETENEECSSNADPDEPAEQDEDDGGSEGSAGGDSDEEAEQDEASGADDAGGDQGEEERGEEDHDGEQSADGSDQCDADDGDQGGDGGAGDDGADEGADDDQGDDDAAGPAASEGDEDEAAGDDEPAGADDSDAGSDAADDGDADTGADADGDRGDGDADDDDAADTGDDSESDAGGAGGDAGEDGAGGEDDEGDAPAPGDAAGDSDGDDPGGDGEGEEADDEPVEDSQEASDGRGTDDVAEGGPSGMRGVLDALCGEQKREALEKSSTLHAVMQSEIEVDSRAVTGHRAYTEEFDQIIEPVGEATLESYSRAYDAVKPYVNVIAGVLTRVLLSRTTATTLRGRHSGAISLNAISQLRAGQSNVFQTRQEGAKLDTYVELVVDHSGSMDGSKIETAMQTCIALAESLAKIGIPFGISGFTTGLGCEEDEAQDKDLWRRARDYVYGAFANPDLADFERIDPIVEFRYKTPETPFAQMKTRLALMPGQMMGANADGDSIYKIAKRVSRRRESRKVIIVMSDGFPAARQGKNIEGDAAERYMAHVAKLLTRTPGLELVGIGIMSDAVKHYYPRCAVINNVADLPAVAMNELKHALMG